LRSLAVSLTAAGSRQHSLIFWYKLPNEYGARLSNGP